MTRTRITLALVLFVTALALPSVAQDKALEMTAFAINMGSGPNAGTVRFTIDRWTTDEQRAEMIAAFKEQGSDGLLKWLEKQKRVGFMRFANTTGFDIQYAFEFPQEDGGRRIVLASDRRLGFREVATSARTTDYPFSLIQIHLDKNGKGEGKFAVSAKIEVSKDGRSIEIENYGQQPVRLNEVTVVK